MFYVSEMLLRSPARRWLSSDVQSDLVLVCSDGAVPAHSALLAGSSPFLSALLSAPSSRHCAGCSAPRSLLLAGVGVAECRALVDLLYTGKAPYTREVSSLLGLCEMLGLELAALDVVNKTLKTVTSQLRPQAPCGDSERVDGVHRRFNRDHASCESIPGCQDLEPIRNNQTPNKLSVITSGLKLMFSGSQSKIPKHQIERSPSLSLKRGERMSQDLAAEPLHSFPTKKLPSKSPEVFDNILAEEDVFPKSSQHKTFQRPAHHPQPGPSTSVVSSSPGQVMVPNSVLSEVMQMMPVEAIKMEAETERSDAEYPQMEGREADDEDREKASAVSSYLSMNNSRNYVCQSCDTGFTFVRSYNWHLARCKAATSSNTPSRITNIPSSSRPAVTVVVCKICNASVTGLKSHLALVHFKSQLLEKFSSSPRKCNICNKSFKSIHSLILHIGIHHGMVKKLSQSSNPIFKRKMLTSGKRSQPSKSKEQIKSSRAAEKEKNSLYKASLIKKKLSSTNLVSANSLYGASQINKLMSKSSSQKSPLKKIVDSQNVKDVIQAIQPLPPARKEACGSCVKCLLPDCGACPQCAGGGAQGLKRVCVKKVCRNKIWTNN